MKIILYIALAAAAWWLGITEGDCTFAVMLSAIPIFTGIEIAVAQLHGEYIKGGQVEEE